MSTASSESKARLLVAEDDRALRELLVRILDARQHEITAVGDGLSAIARLAERYDLVLTDLRMPGADGLEVLRVAKQRWPATPVVVITAFGSIAGAVEAMRLGAFDYLTKPLPEPQTLRDLVARALGQGSETPALEPIAVDAAMKRVIGAALKVAGRETTVLLSGESGTGKEVIARLLHDRSGPPRQSGPFVAVNCAALSESLLESELFGHERGAFTGADRRREGKFAQADGGTLFLDEVGETSAALQAKLLRVLQERSFERVGGSETIRVDVRVVAATNRDLRQAVAAGAFREDLYYRLAVFPIEIPPLRQRSADVVPLAEHFLALLSRGPSRTAPRLTDEARAALQGHDWPGNVRELQNVVERALVLGGGEPIGVALLGLPTAQAAADASQPAGGTLKDMERQAIAAALRAEQGNRRRAARRLGIALRTLQYKIKEYGL